MGMSAPLSGTLDVDDYIHLALDDGTISFDGPINLGGDMLLTIRGGPANGQTHRFHYTAYY